MPCTDAGWPTQSESDAQEIKNLRKRNDMLARTACAALTVLEDLVSNSKGVPLEMRLMKPGGLTETHLKESMAWWAKHKVADAAKKAKERKAQEAEDRAVKSLNALSTEELQFLKRVGILSLKGERVLKDRLAAEKPKKVSKKKVAK